MTGFTKGPWFAGHLGSDSKCQCRSILAEGYMGCVATVEVDNGRPVSDGGNDAPPLDEAIANMHLIAAAPDLYEALSDCIDIIETEAAQFYHCPAVDAAKQSLAKARGEV